MTSHRLVQKLHEFIKMQGRAEKSPGFSSALGLSTLGPKAYSVNKEGGAITLNFPVTTERLLPRQNVISLSTYLAIIDDVTTWALVLGDEKRSRPGKSVSLSLWAGPSTVRGREPGDEVDIVTNVQKIGRNMGFCNATVRDTATGGLVCFASHVKYLPMGPLFDVALSSYGWKAATLYSEYFLSDPPSEAPPLTDLFDSLEFVSDTKATFDVLPIHASLGGPIHGGCQAVLMEMVGIQVAKREFGTDQVSLDSVQIEYMSSPSSKTVELQAQVLPRSEKSNRINMRIKLVGDGKTKSEGVMCFSKRQ